MLALHATLVRCLAVAATALLLAVPARGLQTELTDEQVLAAFDAMSETDQRGVVDYLRLDLSYANRFQLTLTRYALGFTDRDPGFWPDAPEIRWYDPETYAPAQPIPRRVLELESSALQSMRRDMTRSIPERRLRRGFAYDWTTGDVRRLEGADDPRRVVENALQGFNPDLDLAEALVLRALDDGAQREAFVAFDHRYTDRNGRVFPTISLYDAWSSGLEIEMPDIDVLGLATDLVPEKKWRKQWVAPIPSTEHDRLYGAIGDRFVPAKQFRSLREALVRCYLISRPALRDGFGTSHMDVFHAFWDVHSSEIDKGRDELPEPGKGWNEFLVDWVKKLGKDEDLLARMRTRSATLAADEAFVRARLIAVMQDVGAFERD